MEDVDPLLMGSETVSPYRFAANEIANRLLWDLTPESWRSRRILRGWRNRYAGQKAVILCNGPSLLKVDLGLLKNTFTFGLNKINLLFDKTDFRPSCVAAVNPLVLEQNAEFYNSTDIPLFLDSGARQKVTARESVAFLKSCSQRKVALDCSISIYQGHTVTFVAMQLALHMGFREVALVGCDHNFVASGSANTEVAAGEKDLDHFDPNYFAGTMKWHLPDLVQSEINYMMAQQVFEALGGRIVNCTVSGKLELLERTELSEFLQRD